VILCKLCAVGGGGGVCVCVCRHTDKKSRSGPYKNR
jgi:hypothetical protein